MNAKERGKLIQKLRNFQRAYTATGGGKYHMTGQAADEIESLAKELCNLRAEFAPDRNAYLTDWTGRP